jgi:hypothetical protein
LTSIIGGFPGEKNRSLIFEELRSMAVRSAAVEKVGGDGARAGATAAADWVVTLGEDIRPQTVHRQR